MTLPKRNKAMSAFAGVAVTTGTLLALGPAAGIAAADQKIAGTDHGIFHEEMTRDFGHGLGIASFWVKYARLGDQCETTTYFNMPMPEDAMNYLPRVNAQTRTIDILPGGKNNNVCPPW